MRLLFLPTTFAPTTWAALASFAITHYRAHTNNMITATIHNQEDNTFPITGILIVCDLPIIIPESEPESDTGASRNPEAKDNIH
jgi:hypothetical protein